MCPPDAGLLWEENDEIEMSWKILSIRPITQIMYSIMVTQPDGSDFNLSLFS